MKGTLIFIFITFGLYSSGQLTIHSKDKTGIDEHKLDNIDSMNISPSSELKTSSTETKNNVTFFKLYLQRNETIVKLNLTLQSGTPPENIHIERKSSAPLSEYRTIKIFSQNELESLIKNKELVFEDNYTESRQLDSYYRVKYYLPNDVVKISAGIMLSGQTKGNNDIYGQYHMEDPNLFIDDEMIAKEKEAKDNYGVVLTAVRDNIAISLKITDNNHLNINQVVWIERKTSEYLATFRKIKELSKEEIAQLTETKELIIEDKYPPSSKLTCYFRICIKYPNGTVKEFPFFELTGLRAN